ncbi:TRAP transporter small permease [Pseudorhodoplanes sp.]|uniref:TRAP transporter small permease n=1 Tax=Pseudorhodoplanes sp. TaxID=1934341 RepID=UPI003D1057B7
MNYLSYSYGKFLEILANSAALLLLAMVLIVAGDILLRNLFVRGILWANEMSEYALYLITLLTAPWLLRRGQHVRLDILLTALPKGVAWIMEAIGDIAGFIVCLIMIRYGTLMTFDALQMGSLTIKNLIVPEWWMFAPLPLTFFLLSIEFIFRFQRLLQKRVPREDATSVA